MNSSGITIERVEEGRWNDLGSIESLVEVDSLEDVLALLCEPESDSGAECLDDDVSQSTEENNAKKVIDSLNAYLHNEYGQYEEPENNETSSAAFIVLRSEPGSELKKYYLSEKLNIEKGKINRCLLPIGGNVVDMQNKYKVTIPEDKYESKKEDE